MYTNVYYCVLLYTTVYYRILPYTTVYYCLLLSTTTTTTTTTTLTTINVKVSDLRDFLNDAKLRGAEEFTGSPKKW